jgi:hypothetical protein
VPLDAAAIAVYAKYPAPSITSTIITVMILCFLENLHTAPGADLRNDQMDEKNFFMMYEV